VKKKVGKGHTEYEGGQKDGGELPSEMEKTLACFWQRKEPGQSKPWRKKPVENPYEIGKGAKSPLKAKMRKVLLKWHCNRGQNERVGDLIRKNRPTAREDHLNKFSGGKEGERSMRTMLRTGKKKRQTEKDSKRGETAGRKKTK